MPALIVLVHDDVRFRDEATLALQATGLEVMAFSGSMAALTALESAKTVELLITRVSFPAGTPNGISLALVARAKRPGLKVLFTSKPETQEFIGDIGTHMPTPVTIPELVAAAMGLLNRK
jgi:DNA-binding NtrC family response regulator